MERKWEGQMRKKEIGEGEKDRGKKKKQERRRTRQKKKLGKRSVPG